MKKRVLFFIGICIFSINCLIGQENVPITDLLLLLPDEAFDNAVEGISFDEKTSLIKTGKCETWTLVTQNDTVLKIKNNFSRDNSYIISAFMF